MRDARPGLRSTEPLADKSSRYMPHGFLQNLQRTEPEKSPI